MKLMAREPPTKAMPTTPARHEAARLMYLPNRKGTLKRDNDYRQKVGLVPALSALLPNSGIEHSAPSRQAVKIMFWPFPRNLNDRKMLLDLAARVQS